MKTRREFLKIFGVSIFSGVGISILAHDKPEEKCFIDNPTFQTDKSWNVPKICIRINQGDISIIKDDSIVKFWPRLFDGHCNPQSQKEAFAFASRLGGGKISGLEIGDSTVDNTSDLGKFWTQYDNVSLYNTTLLTDTKEIFNRRK